ncbi:hypothetical protein BT96DRAFT_925621 [Gymnopus androsaceus JB14]|uniref:Uncharacterized protein n=1 Tax=Gymnopus androsaceus JB14 TaxID=1447944 RepID=A0A6A4GYS1_9AGAR|nr:hypothetical protein BT96DRAFT_925621 [Gymnopus androsaceus JB14]
MSAVNAQNLYLLEVESISSSLGSVLYGIYFVTAVLALFSLASQGKDFSSGRRFLIAHDIRSLGGLFQPKATQILILADAIFSKLNFFLSDLVIVWRAWSICDRTPSTHIIFLFCVCLSFGVVIADIILALESSLDLKMKFTLEYETSRIVLPLGLLLVNVIATSFIAFRAWKFHRALKYSAPEESGKIRHLTQVLLVMVESGCLYSVLWILVLLDILLKFSMEAAYLITTIIPHITGLYPCLIVLLVIFKKSRYEAINRTAWSTSPQESAMAYYP